MPYVKVWIHAVWSTKNREAILTKEIRSKLFRHIFENGKEKSIYIDFINGMPDHVHCLFGLNASMAISKTMQMIKGESAYWINKNNLTKTKFEWADEYFAASVSESSVNKVRDYIRNQELHHSKKNFSDEYDSFISKVGLIKNE